MWCSTGARHATPKNMQKRSDQLWARLFIIKAPGVILKANKCDFVLCLVCHLGGLMLSGLEVLERLLQSLYLVAQVRGLIVQCSILLLNLLQNQDSSLID